MFLSSSQYHSCLFTVKCFSCEKKKLTQRSVGRQEACVLNHVQLFATLWTVVHQTLPPVESSRQEYWRRLPFLPPGDLPDPGLEPTSLASPALEGRFFTTGKIVFGNFVSFFLFLQIIYVVAHLLSAGPGERRRQHTSAVDGPGAEAEAYKESRM